MNHNHSRHGLQLYAESNIPLLVAAISIGKIQFDTNCVCDIVCVKVFVVMILEF
jgi:hypothetical protein